MADRPFQRLRRFLSELRRRNVYQVAATYAVVGFVLIQLADLTFVRLGLPAWTVTFVIVLVAVGFPLSLVFAWAFEVTPEGVRRTPQAEPSEEAEAEAGSRTAYKVLVGLGLVAAAVAGGWYLTGGGGESPEVTDGTVAVLPFEVSGSGTADWQDGMVTYLTPGLDGAAGLRAIPDRTVFAAWEESRQTDRGASAEEALAVAREIGSEYAVVGSAGGLGSQVRFIVAVYETVSGERLGQVEVRGPPDSVPALADSLTRRVLGLMLKESGEHLPSVDLGRITTRSLPALKSYLAGERHFRAAEYEAAVEDYEAAVAQDSSFALAYARLDLSRAWAGHGRGSRAPLRRAYEMSDRLPERERRLVRAQHLWTIRYWAVAAADTLRRLTEEYPDDPSMWYWLGETLIHGTIPGGWPEAEEAFQRAVRLDPGVAPYHHHLVDLAMSWHHDSALAAQRLEAHPSSQVKHWYQALWDLNFGSADRRPDAWTRIDTLPVGAQWWVYFPLQHPTDLALRDTVLRRVTGREDINPTEYATLRIRTHVFRGQPGQVLTDLRTRDEDPGVDACALADALVVDYPVPDSVARRYLAPEYLPDQPSHLRFICAGVYLVESGRSDELDGLIRRLRATVDTAGPGAVSADWREGAVRELRGYRAWKRGDLERAAQTWNPSDALGPLGALPRGDLYRQLGELETAEGWYQEAWGHPVAHEKLGQLYEEMGEPEKAVAAYRRFIEAWENADEELQPRVEAARERLEKLTGSQPEPND